MKLKSCQWDTDNSRGKKAKPTHFISLLYNLLTNNEKKVVGEKTPTTTKMLEAGDTLYMSTDGWIDSINPERKRFGSQQFKEMLLQGANLSLKAQNEIFRHILDDYEQGTEQRDDVLLVGVRV